MLYNFYKFTSGYSSFPSNLKDIKNHIIGLYMKVIGNYLMLYNFYKFTSGYSSFPSNLKDIKNHIIRL